MKKRDSISHSGLQYEAFLFEPLGQDRNGAPLALASLLGRMSLDPWEEAALFAAMPADVAVGKLASLIAATPGRLYSQLQSKESADRLVKLLPARRDPVQPEPDLASLSDAPASRRLISYVGWIALACVIVWGVIFG